MLEGQETGRLFVRRLDGSLDVILVGLQFANGAALDPEEASLFVAETGRYRIRRHWLSGDKAGTTEVFVDNLPGFPDNLSLADGILWTGAPPQLPKATLKGAVSSGVALLWRRPRSANGRLRV